MKRNGHAGEGGGKLTVAIGGRHHSLDARQNPRAPDGCDPARRDARIRIEAGPIHDGDVGGPTGCAVSVKLTLKVDDVALTVIAPGVAPAVTVVDACPVESVMTEEEPSVATPEATWKFTCAPAMPLPFESTTLTTSG